jgi:hypothetical protein
MSQLLLKHPVVFLCTASYIELYLHAFCIAADVVIAGLQMTYVLNRCIQVSLSGFLSTDGGTTNPLSELPIC